MDNSILSTIIDNTKGINCPFDYVCKDLYESGFTLGQIKDLAYNGDPDAVVLMYIGLTTPEYEYGWDYFIDEENNDEIIPVLKRGNVLRDAIFLAPEEDVKIASVAITILLAHLPKEQVERYWRIFKGSADGYILLVFAALGYDEAMDEYELRMSLLIDQQS